jgi:hypothetical protein
MRLRIYVDIGVLIAAALPLLIAEPNSNEWRIVRVVRSEVQKL